jgi:hypothetical protein
MTSIASAPGWKARFLAFQGYTFTGLATPPDN